MKTVDTFIVTFYSDLDILSRVLHRLSEAVRACSNASFRVTLVDNSHGREQPYFEKLYQELLIGDNPMPTEHPRIMKAQETFKAWAELEKELITLQGSLNAGDAQSIYNQLKQLVTGFIPDKEIVDFLFDKDRNKN